MHIVFDIGNTSQRWAVFEGDEIKFVFSGQAIDLSELENILNQSQISHFILSSVVKKDIDFERWLLNKIPGIVLTHQTPLPLKNKYATPETLGKDRLANAVGGAAKFPGQNVLTIDAGTCIKYDFVNGEKVYLGGAISPGLTMRMQSLHNYTAALPLIDHTMLKEAKDVPLTGNSTSQSILSGVGNGAVMEVSGIIKRYAEQYGTVTTVLTGGDMWFFELHLKTRIFALPNLTLFGLHTILDHNLKTN